jgi:GntR family transcriptional repressor for pyruvate dehydrogenase complex
MVTAGSLRETERAIDRNTLSDQLIIRIARDIVRGRLTAGDPLPSEQELAAAFSVSKPTIREATRALADLGLIHAQQGKRTVIRASRAWNVLDPRIQEAYRLEERGAELASQLYETRIVLETSSAAFAALRADPEHVALMRSLVDQLRAIADSKAPDLDEFLRVDREFHDVVAQASGNVVLRQVVRRVNGDLTQAWSSASISPDELNTLVEIHAGITAAIADGDAERASAEMRSHLERAAAKATPE